MDMNWIDEIRDPEPRKRYIYNADDYDPQYGDPYYREHSTRADSLWRLYEESGTSITFDAFADESRQTDYRMETGALRDFFNGSQSALSSYRNPMGGNPLIAFGSIGRWDGERTGISSFETFDDLMNGDDPPFKDCETFRRRMRSGRPVEPRTVIVIRHDPVNVRNDTDKGHGIIGRQR